MGDWNAIFRQKGTVFLKPIQEIRNLATQFRKSGTKRILDLGCGSGRHTVFLASKGFEAHASDTSPQGLRITKAWLKKKSLSAKLKRFSCYEPFPYPDNYFDALVSTQVIHHNYHPKILRCIREIYRVVKPGGLIFISVAAKKTKTRATHSRMVAPHTYIPLDGDEQGLPHFIYTKELLKKDFIRFKDVRITNLEDHLYLWARR